MPIDDSAVSISFDPVPSPKGASTHISAVARCLADTLGGLDLVTLPPAMPEDAGEAPLLSHPGLRHHHISARGENLIARIMDFRQKLGWWWGQRRPRVVHLRSIWEGFPLALRHGRAYDKLVYEVNGLPSIELKYHYPAVADDREFLAKVRAQEDCCLQAADRVITVSEVNAAYLRGRGVDADKIRVIRNGVERDERNWSAGDLDTVARGWRPLRLLYIGTMSAWQGLPVALEALALYRRDLPATLTVVGVGRRHQRRQFLDRAADLGLGEAVHLLEPMDHDALLDCHRQHDIALAPLLANDRNCEQGCSPLKILDALAAGRPIVASDLPVVRELVCHEREALLVRPGNARSLKNALLRLGRESGLLTRLACNAAARAPLHDWQLRMAELRAVYAELMTEDSSAASRSAS